MRTTFKKELIKKAGAFFVFCLTMITSISLFAQPYIGWIQRYNGPGNNYDAAAAIAVDGDGNVYVTGSSNDSVNSSGIATIKYDKTGYQLWVARYNGIGDSIDQVLAVVVDHAENVYVTGQSYGIGTGYDCVTIKYFPNGDTAWVRRYNGPGNGNDGCTALKVDDNGNVYVTGYSYGSSTSYDYVTLKYDSIGNERWVRRHNASNYDDVAHDLVLDRNGNIYLTGDVNVNGITHDYGTIKYDSIGNQLWQVGYGGVGDDRARSLDMDIAGNIYVTGGNFDYATVKYDKNGNLKWAKIYDGGFPDIARKVKVDSRGNVYVTGSSISDFATIKYDSLGNQLWLQRYDGILETDDRAFGMTLDTAGNVYVTGFAKSSDIFTIKYDPYGNQVWSLSYDGVGNGTDEAFDIAVDNSGNVYMTGKSMGRGTDFDIITIKYSPIPILKGDLDENGVLTLDDIVSLLNCVFSGSRSCPPAFADVNCDGILSPADVVVLLLTFFASAPPPC